MSEEPNVSGDQMEAAAPVETETLAPEEAATQKEERQVPLDALQAERAERQKLQDELKMVKDNMSLMMAQSQQKSSPAPKEELDGLSDDDVLTVGEFKKALTAKERQYNMNLQEMRMTQKHPDYQEVVVKYLPEVLKQNPSLRNTLESSNDYELAYHLAKNSDAYKADNKRQKKNADAERIVQNAERAGTLSSVGQTSPISQAKRYSKMSDADFQKEMNRNLGYF
jgi:hypothetical protein